MAGEEQHLVASGGVEQDAFHLVQALSVAADPGVVQDDERGLAASRSRSAPPLPQLGQRLKAARKAAFPIDDLSAFALRLGVARSTLQRMEQGDLSVALSRYYRAAELLDMTEGFTQLFVKEESLFDD